MPAFAQIQRKAISTLSPTMRSAQALSSSHQATMQHASRLPYSLADIPIAAPRKNITGLPDKLKTGVEQLSGLSLDDVSVHYNSSKPSSVHALAYTRGTQIYVAPGQERHLAHEAWHVVQQKQGRVQPTAGVGGVAVNEDRQLEREATAMGTRASRGGSGSQQTGRVQVDYPTTLASAPIQYLKSDAEQYITDNGLDLEKVSRENVEEYVNDKTNSAVHRKGLLDAWNKGQSSRFAIDEPADLASGDSDSESESNSEYESDDVQDEAYNPSKLTGTFDVTRSKGDTVTLPSLTLSPSGVRTVAYAQRKRPRDSTFAVTHPTEAELSGEFARGPFTSSDYVYYSHDYSSGVPRREQHGGTFGELSGRADRVAKRLKTDEGLSQKDARELVSEQIYGQTRGEDFDDRISDKEKAPLFHFSQALLADKGRSFDARETIQESLAEHDKSFAVRFPDKYKEGAYRGSGSGGRKRLRDKRKPKK